MRESHGHTLNPLQGTHNVRALDTEVSCRCGRALPRIYGPLQVSVYCAGCVEAERCPCYSRPNWHGGGI